MSEAEFIRTCHENNEARCYNSLCKSECYIKRVREGVKAGYRICPITDLNCWSKECLDDKCQMDRSPFNTKHKDGEYEAEKIWERSIISKQLRIIDRLTEEHHHRKHPDKPLLVLTTIFNNQTFIIMDIQLTLGATPKGPGIFTLIDTKTGAVIPATFSNQQIGANSNPSAATFAFADTTNNSVTGSPVGAGTGTIGFSTNATYTDSLGNPQTNVPFTITKNFIVSLGADGVSFDVVFP